MSMETETIIIPVVLSIDDQIIPVSLEADEVIIPMQTTSIVKINADIDRYTGSYEVTPKAHTDVVLPTTDKLLEDDVRVKKVPYFEVSNTKGITVYIADGGEIING